MLLGDYENRMGNRGRTRIALTDLNTNGVVHQGLGHRIDRLRQGCAKAPNVSALGSLLENLLHVIPEAHVEHLVCFVQHNVLKIIKKNLPLAVQIEQPSRRGH